MVRLNKRHNCSVTRGKCSFKSVMKSETHFSWSLQIFLSIVSIFLSFTSVYTKYTDVKLNSNQCEIR